MHRSFCTVFETSSWRYHRIIETNTWPLLKCSLKITNTWIHGSNLTFWITCPEGQCPLVFTGPQCNFTGPSFVSLPIIYQISLALWTSGPFNLLALDKISLAQGRRAILSFEPWIILKLKSTNSSYQSRKSQSHLVLFMHDLLLSSGSEYSVSPSLLLLSYCR